MDRTRRAILLFACLQMLGCSSADLIDNPRVDRWCGERPCAWDVEGDIERVGSWHENDYAVALLGERASLSQWNPDLDAVRSSCLGFSLIADVDARARVFVELDFLGDGSVEFSQRLPETHWKRRTFSIKTPSWYEGVRFSVRKESAGRAVLAELRAMPATDCTAERVSLLGRPGGAACEENSQCAGTICKHGSCSSCQSDADCEPSAICGLTYIQTRMVEQCVAPGATEFGGVCATSAECSQGSCCSGVCSACCPGELECEDGALCEQVSSPGLQLDAPFMCGRSAGLAASGALCVGDEDCASGRCQGEELGCVADLCEDAPPDESCLWFCNKWRFHGGTCD